MKRGVKSDSWTEYPDTPIDARRPDMVKHFGLAPTCEEWPDSQWHPTARDVFYAMRKLPHTVDFGEPEWLMLEQAVRMLHRYHSNSKIGLSTLQEANLLLRRLGFTQDDRNDLRIRYVPVDEVSAPVTPTTSADATTANNNVVNFRRTG